MIVVRTHVHQRLVLEECVSEVGVRVMGQHVWSIVNAALVLVLSVIQTLDFADLLPTRSQTWSEPTVQHTVLPNANWKNVPIHAREPKHVSPVVETMAIVAKTAFQNPKYRNYWSHRNHHKFQEVTRAHALVAIVRQERFVAVIRYVVLVPIYATISVMEETETSYSAVRICTVSTPRQENVISTWLAIQVEVHVGVVYVNPN